MLDNLTELVIRLFGTSDSSVMQCIRYFLGLYKVELTREKRCTKFLQKTCHQPCAVPQSLITDVF